MNNKLNKSSKIILLLLILVISLSGCAQIRDKIATTKGELIGQHFNISVYDHYANKVLSMDGSRIGIQVFDSRRKVETEDGEFDSSVLEITVNGDQMIQVGNTMIFAEDGLDMVEDFEIPEELKAQTGGGLIPVDRYINDIKNKIGKGKTVVILSPKGVPIGVYEGKKVFVTVPKNLPKMTRLNIDGKSLYIHRANYIIMDTEIIN